MNPKQQTKPHSPAPATSDEIRVSYVRFVTKAMAVIPVSGKPATSIEEYIVARRSGTEDGYDIAWVPARRAFRLDRYVNGARIGRRWVPETRVEIWEELAE